MIAADTIGFVIPAAAAEKERHFKLIDQQSDSKYN